MTIRKVARMGHPVLRKKAKQIPVEDISTPLIQTLIKDMVETMHEYGGIGLAAPQVHESLQLAIIGISRDGRVERSEGQSKEALTVFINPIIKILDKKTQGCWEGCLSVPGLRGYVERPRKVRVEYYNERGEKEVMVAENFSATVIQHELDHLAGTLYIDRMTDLKKLTFNEESEKYHQTDDNEMNE